MGPWRILEPFHLQSRLAQRRRGEELGKVADTLASALPLLSDDDIAIIFRDWLFPFHGSVFVHEYISVVLRREFAWAPLWRSQLRTQWRAPGLYPLRQRVALPPPHAARREDTLTGALTALTSLPLAHYSALQFYVGVLSDAQQHLSTFVTEMLLWNA